MAKQFVETIKNYSFYTNIITSGLAFKHINSTFSFRHHSTFLKTNLDVKFIPALTKDVKLIIPISAARYLKDENATNQYDKEIKTLLQFTSNLLNQNNIKVDILCSADLNQKNFNDSKLIEKHLIKTHGDLLKKHSHFFTWHNLIDSIGKDKFKQNYEIVKSLSQPGSRWYDLMIKTFKSIRIISNIEDSIEYQRKEYATILSMKNFYSHIAYMGNISIAWAYIYELFPNHNLPKFSKIIIQHKNSKKVISLAEANYMIQMIASNIEQILENNDFPRKEKEKLKNIISIFHYLNITNESVIDFKEENSITNSKKLISL